MPLSAPSVIRTAGSPTSDTLQMSCSSYRSTASSPSSHPPGPNPNGGNMSVGVSYAVSAKTVGIDSVRMYPTPGSAPSSAPWYCAPSYHSTRSPPELVHT